MSRSFDADKLDTGMDSGVCPSPDESYQSYYDAFPALSTSNILLGLEQTKFSCDRNTSFHCQNNWHNVKRGADNVCRTSSSSPCRLTNILSKSIGCNSAPSPTSSDHTPSKRPKLLAQSSVKSGLHDVINYTAAPSSIPVFKDDRRFSLHSCPNLVDRKESSPFNIFLPAMPNFCCPQVCQSVDTSAKTVFMPSLSGIENVATHPPHFVVPKCFKAASWPSKSEWRVASDVPFWSCGEWFCTLHKGLQLGLLTAKVNEEAAKLLSPDPVFQQQQRILNALAASNQESEGDNAFRDEYYSAWMNKPKISVEMGFCGDRDMLNEEYFYDALVSDDNDLPPLNVPHHLPTIRQPVSCDAQNKDWSFTQDPLHFKNDYAAWNSPGHIEIPSTFDQLKAANNSTITLDAYWPDSTIDIKFFPNNDVPEFDPYLSSQPPANVDLSSHYLQEVGFCLPKFDVSPTNVQSKTASSAAGQSYPSFQAKNVCTNESSVKQPIQSLFIPLSIQINTQPVMPESKTKTKSIAVPIGSDTHFVPIRSESMEDAYFLKPGFDESALRDTRKAEPGAKGLTYVEETGYYVFLESENINDNLESPINSVDECNENNPIKLTQAQQLDRQHMKVSKSLGNFGSSCSNIFSSLPLKFRASKPGKMVQTEEKYFIYCDGRDRYYLNGPGGDDDSLICDLDIDDLLSVEAALEIGADDDDANNMDTCGSVIAGDGDFEIWACKTLQMFDDSSGQARWTSSGDIKARLASFSEKVSRQANLSKQPFYRGASSLEGPAMGCGAQKNRDEMEMWLKEDERDEEMLLRYVSNISLISPLDIGSCDGNASS